MAIGTEKQISITSVLIGIQVLDLQYTDICNIEPMIVARISLSDDEICTFAICYLICGRNIE